MPRASPPARSGYGRNHLGVIVLPSVIGHDLARLFRAVLPTAEQVFSRKLNMFIEITQFGQVTSFQLP